jgi:hypothetical protein
MLWIFERRMLRIYGPIKEHGVCRSRSNHELYKLCNEPAIVKVIKVGRLKWLGQLFRTHEQNPCRKLALHKPEGAPWVGRPAIRWLDSVEEDLNTITLQIGDESHRFGTKGEKSWKWPRFVMDCSACRRKRIMPEYMGKNVKFMVSEAYWEQ